VDLYQLRTFVTVAREGSVTRASELLHLSQPAVSAHIKSMEDTLGISLFERTPRGMSLTRDGQRLLKKAEETLAAHQALLAEAARGKGELSGTLCLGAGSNSSHEAVGRLMTALAARCPSVEVTLKHRGSQEVLAGIRNGTLDAGFYNEPGEPDADLETIEVARFSIVLVAAKGLVRVSDAPDWKAMAELPWIYPTESACCRRTAERVFAAQLFKPKRIVSADRQEIVRTLVASGIGVGLLHADGAEDALQRGDIELLYEPDAKVGVRFAYLKSRAEDPLLAVAASIMRGEQPGRAGAPGRAT
jgi:DNA-binding transcriptional LysR family regulator